MNSMIKNSSSGRPYIVVELWLVACIVVAFIGFCIFAYSKITDHTAEKPPCTAAFREDFKETALKVDDRFVKGKLKILDNSRPYYVAFSYQFPDGVSEPRIQQLGDGSRSSHWSVTYTLNNTLYAYIIPRRVEWPECDETVLITDFTATLPH